MPVAIAAALPELWPAIAVLLVAWASWVLLTRPLTTLLGSLPVVGGYVARSVSDGISALVRWALSWAATAVRPLVELVAAPVTWLDQTIGWAVNVAEALEAELGTVARETGARLGSLGSSIASLAASVGSLGSLLSATRSWLASVAGSVATIVSTAIPTAIVSAVAQARTIAAGLDAALRTDLLGRIAAAAGAASAALAAAVASLTGQIGALRTWAAGAIAAATATAIGAVDALRRDHDAVLGRHAAEIGSIVSALAPLIALQLTRVVPQTIARIDSLERDCIRPTCDVLSPQLRDLEALLDGTALALVLGLVGTAIADPIGAGRTVGGEAGELRSIATGVVGPAIGIR
ncbi:MAG TPA: hypothetical protein VNJ28_04640 [Candidatus Limnocylindrales bacterium]|nr:hypothetical protein [Candidatus Limnocylindrales bacterium]